MESLCEEKGDFLDLSIMGMNNCGYLRNSPMSAAGQRFFYTTQCEEDSFSGASTQLQKKRWERNFLAQMELENDHEQKFVVSLENHPPNPANKSCMVDLPSGVRSQ